MEPQAEPRSCFGLNGLLGRSLLARQSYELLGANTDMVNRLILKVRLAGRKVEIVLASQRSQYSVNIDR